MSVDPAAYRDPKEVEQARLLDPLLLAQARYEALGGPVQDLPHIDAQAQQEVQAALAAAEAAPWPDLNEAYTDIQTTGEGQWF